MADVARADGWELYATKCARPCALRGDPPRTPAAGCRRSQGGPALCTTQTSTLPGGHLLVAVSGEIDISTAPALRLALTLAIRAAITGVIVDLGEVTFIDALGLRALAGASAQARHLPGGLRLAAIPGHMLRLLKLTQLDQRLAVFPAPPQPQAQPQPQPQPQISPAGSGPRSHPWR